MCLQVFLNGQRLPIKSFKDYVDLYVKDKDAPRVHERVNDRWEIIICASEGQFQQVRGPAAQRQVQRNLCIVTSHGQSARPGL
jgi:hypothetical protein